VADDLRLDLLAPRVRASRPRADDDVTAPRQLATMQADGLPHQALRTVALYRPTDPATGHETESHRIARLDRKHPGRDVPASETTPVLVDSLEITLCLEA
jgi:hypothetical protein